MNKCVLCGLTQKEIEEKYSSQWPEHKRKNPKNEGYHTVTSHKKELGEAVSLHEHHISYFPEETIMVCSKCHGLIHQNDEFIGTIYRPPIGHSNIFYEEGVFEKDNLKYEAEANEGWGGFRKDYSGIKIINLKLIKIFICPYCDHINTFEEEKKINRVLCSECGFDWEPPFEGDVEEKVWEVYIISFEEPYRVWTEKTGHARIHSDDIKIIEEEEIDLDDGYHHPKWYKKSKKVKAIIKPKAIRKYL